MSRGLQADSVTSRIRALLPATLSEIRAGLPDVRKPQIANALKHATIYGHIAFDGITYRRTHANPKPRRELTMDTDQPTNILGHGLAPSRPYVEDPSRGALVPCPQLGPQPIGVCLNSYTDAEAGVRAARRECAGCQYGAERRAMLAKGAS